MSSLSTFLKNNLASFVLKANHLGFASPGTVYLALFKTNPTIADSGTEAPWPAYVASGGQRQACSFGTISGATISNDAIETFPGNDDTVTHTITHWGLYDAQGFATSGNLLLFGALTVSKDIEVNDVPSFPIGSLAITFN
ncbi:MAG: hypothetical protein IPL86_15885 [Flavobacteriales bacterium]|nr:hypothetical protein [Flavobacteriales bacterium]